MPYRVLTGELLPAGEKGPWPTGERIGELDRMLGGLARGEDSVRMLNDPFGVLGAFELGDGSANAVSGECW